MRILTLVLLVWTGIVIGQTSKDLVLKTQSITISPEKIKVLSQYLNQSDQDLTETFVFTNPVSLSVDMQPLHVQLIQHAISSTGRDVSAQLTALGLPFDQVAAMQTIDASSNRDSISSKLLGLQLIDPKENIPNWIVKNYYYCQYTFPASSSVTIELNYKPNIATKGITINNITSMLTAPLNVMKKAVDITANNMQNQMQKHIANLDTYCISSADYQAVAKAKQNSKNQKSQIETRSLTFKYNSDDLWVKPLERFTLNIDSHDNLYPVLCWNGKMQRDANDALRFSADNYVPLQDISVLYIEK